MKLSKHKQRELLYLAKLVTEERKSKVINFAKEKEINDLSLKLLTNSYYELRFFAKLMYLLDKNFKLTKKERLELFNMHYMDNTLDLMTLPLTKEEPNKQYSVSDGNFIIISFLIVMLLITLSR